MKTIAESLRRLRLIAGYTQQNIAQYLGIDRSTYSYYEIGKTEPKLEMLVNLSRLYGISLDEMFPARMFPDSSKGDSVKLDVVLAEEQVDFPFVNNANLRRLSQLEHDEQHLIILYRTCGHKEEAIKALEALAKGNKDSSIK